MRRKIIIVLLGVLIGFGIYIWYQYRVYGSDPCPLIYYFGKQKLIIAQHPWLPFIKRSFELCTVPKGWKIIENPWLNDFKL